MPEINVNDLVEETKSTLAKLQEQNEKLIAEGKSNSDGMVELKTKYDELIGQISDLQTKAKGEEAARIELEKMLARMPESRGEYGGENLSDPEYVKAWSDFVMSGGKKEIPREIQEKEAEKYIKAHNIYDPEKIQEVKAHLIGSNPDGGYTVPIDMRTALIKRRHEFSAMRQVAESTTTVRDKVAYPVDDDLALNGYWRDELDATDNTNSAQIGDEEFQVHMLYAEPKVTIEMLDDSGINVPGFIQLKTGEIFAKKESTAFIVGDGVKRPRGVLSYPETGVEVYKKGAIGTKETAASGAYSADDIIKIQYNLLEWYQGNATWMCNRQTFSGIATLKTTDGDYLLNPRILFEGVNPQLLGKSVLFSPDMVAEDTPTSATTGGKILMYGDFREGYLIVDRMGITVLRDPYTDKRFVKFSSRTRVGGGVKNFQAIKVLKVQ